MNLVEALRRAYNHGLGDRSVTVQMVLFGFRYADQIKQNAYSVDRLISEAGIPSHSVMIRLGMKLSEHVELRQL